MIPVSKGKNPELIREIRPIQVPQNFGIRLLAAMPNQKPYQPLHYKKQRPNKRSKSKARTVRFVLWSFFESSKKVKGVKLHNYSSEKQVQKPPSYKMKVESMK